MLDKSLPYYNMIMRCDASLVKKMKPPHLPNGFAFKTFELGDEQRWAMIEHSVAEFSTPQKAESYFCREYLPFADELAQRCFFVVDAIGEYVGTATAWRMKEGDRQWAALHWVAVKPSFQKLGLGRAVVQRALYSFPDVEPGEDVYLHTQTWSHKAVEMYLRFGFVLLKRDCLANKTNDYELAVETLQGRMDEALYQQMINTSI